MFIFFFKQKTAYEMRISDWSSDVCSSDLSLLRSLSPGGSADRRENAAARTGGGCDRLDARRQQGRKRRGFVGADKDALDGLRCREAVEHARQHRPAGDIGEERVEYRKSVV